MTPYKSILIIGAGVAGLAAGCYGQMNGYATRIFELHNLPGGLCTAWERGPYVFDEATPLSYERYTGNWQGSSCGWLLTRQTMPMMLLGMRKTLPGLRNLYLAGQWVEPGGSLPLAAMSGRQAIQMICHQDQRPFRIEI